MKKIISNICFGGSSLVIKIITNSISLINIHLLIVYKSITIFKFALFKNKYFFLSAIFLGIITFLFNKNLNYFNDLTVENLMTINLFQIKSLTFFLVTFYLCYIKLNIFVRIIYLIKAISFFYRKIKLNFKDIRTICLYFYMFNIFFIFISSLFIMNLINNINLINSELALFTDYTTNLISVIILLINLNRILRNKLIINTKEIKPLKILFLILILFTPLKLLIFYSDKNFNLFNHYNIFKFSTIHCDSKDDISSIVKNEVKDKSPSLLNLIPSFMNNREATIIAFLMASIFVTILITVIIYPEEVNELMSPDHSEPDIPLENLNRENN